MPVFVTPFVPRVAIPTVLVRVRQTASTDVKTMAHASPRKAAQMGSMKLAPANAPINARMVVMKREQSVPVHMNA